MRVFQFLKIQNIKVEKSKKTYTLWETFEGYHYMDDMGIMKDEDMRYDSKVVFYDGIVFPMGINENQSKIDELFDLIETIKAHGNNIRIAKLLGRFFDGMMKYIGIIIVLILFAIAFYFSIQPAPHVDQIPIHQILR